MTTVPAIRTHVLPVEMLAALRAGWLILWQEDEQPSTSALCILVAHWALETGRGASMMNYNVAGIKAGQAGDGAYYSTLEVLPRAEATRMLAASTPDAPCELVKDGGGPTLTIRLKPNHPGCRFRAYESLELGVLDYLDLLRRRFSKCWLAVLSGDPHAFAVALKAQGYYTAPLEQYSALMTSLHAEMLRSAPTDPAIEIRLDEVPSEPDIDVDIPLTLHMEGVVQPKD